MKRDRVREISMEIMVGAFIFTVLLALAVLTIVLSRENFFSTTYSLEVRFDEVHGLLDGDLVTMRGVKVGRVRTLQIEKDGVHVFLTLQVSPQIREDYRIEIVPSSILGGQHVSIYEGTERIPLLPKETLLHGLPPPDIMRETSAAIKAIREAMEDGGILEDLKAAMRQVNSITAKMDEGEGTLGKLLNDETAFQNLQEITANLRTVSQRLVDGEGTLAKLLSDDDTVYRDLEEITTNLRIVSGRLSDGKGTLGRLLSEDEQFYTDLSASAAALRDISETISKGEGTIGKLTKDDELYMEAKMLLQEVRATVDDIRESSPLSTFSSVFLGAF